MKKLIFVLLGCLSLITGSYAQQDAQFSQYMFNGLYLNPGYAGIEGVTRASLIHRTQWLGYETSDKNSGTAPNSQILSVNTKLPQNYGGAGLYLLYDRLGPIRNLDIKLAYSYHVKVKDGTLGIGLNGGIYSQRYNDYYYVVDPSDQVYVDLHKEGKVSQVRADITAGLWYNTKKYYAGVSFTHIPKSKFTMGSDAISSKLVNHMYITGGYNFQLGTNIVLTPSALIQTDLNELTYLFGPLATYNNKIWAGLNVRQSFAQKEVSKKGKTLSNDDIIIYLGINLLKNKQGNEALKIGYAFDIVTSAVKAKKGTSHEILLSYLAPTPWGAPKPKVRTPRYRHEEN